MLDLAESENRHKLAIRKLATLIEGFGKKIEEPDMTRLKLEVCREFSLDSVPKNSEVLPYLNQEQRLRLEPILRRKAIRTISGIAVITAITMPFDCPHGTCTFCPGGVRFGTPQSYTRKSPAAAYGIARNFDPVKQVSDALRFLSENGHDTSKAELILLGGTILAMPVDYQERFVKGCYDALNSSPSETLSAAIKQNESAGHRCVGLTIETKPDWCQNKHVDLLLSYGATRVEIGVQSLRDKVLKHTNRGHTVADTITSFQVSKDAALKLVAHMMPGLPLSDADKDLEDLRALFEDENFRPDMLKIYPTLVVEGTTLFQQYKMGKYYPYTLDQLKKLLCAFKAVVPPWVRIMRIQREIPKEEIAQGENAGNLRQLILEEMRKRNLTCHCIRCREVGHRSQKNSEHLELKRIDYDASGGKEVFLSYETDDTLHGFLRLRIPSGKEFRPELRNQRTSLVRELHVYGPVVPLGKNTVETRQSQHRGIGSKLLLEAERISREFSRSKVVVIAAV
ncbi:MAG TPA: tRNA uridine(34) 5-carboxymethylaminomethyl modification radical SAM/GNAT enzyme Elp3, partial [Nitrososphaerales archaeon]|nr:tRNA uridine(34) 5-carboxymethylaminomethyl modification radical SAM/GNAT enzyme Elp3 [Nitrososphaerales archaeon]